MKNDRFNEIGWKRKIGFLTERIGLRNRDLAEILVKRLDLDKQYYIKIVETEEEFREECYRERRVGKNKVEVVDVVVVEGFAECGYKCNGVVVDEVGVVSGVMLVKTRLQYCKFGDESEFNSSRVIYEIVVKGDSNVG